jgi:two-component system cell cycle sensor histidine kinase/response regulator CckA
MKRLSLATDSGAGRRDPECEWRLETLGKVAEGMAHDFNNILATISGFAELILANASGEMRSEKPGTDAVGFAQHILEAALAGQTSVQELRALSRPGADKAEDSDLNAILRQAITLGRGAMGGNVCIRAELCSAPARLNAYRGLLQNAFLNIFINARDAMHKGGTVAVRSWMMEPEQPYDRPEWVVSIRDSGTGMEPEVRDRIFERYFTTKGRKGSGLGLAQVLETVERHGGRITVESEPGAGSEFRLYFPVDRLD